MTQVTVITSVEHRRIWTDDQKLELTEATLEPGANVSEIARAADIAPAQLYRWRKELLDPEPESGFVPVVVNDMPEHIRPEPMDRRDSTDAITIEVGGAVVRIAAHAPPALVTAALEGLRA